ncbi:MAG TPA: DNA polymerase III subunit gamma/tau [Clostridiaceae bacterium]|jgi:DNA polymerase-3 subunit gamma/tau|nr:DNA polymerase III subunit gamma/tau [Clostridia bacterium]CDC07140.1 dNA polymerase III subunit gamma/tau [Clostridium sp. CAG:343]HJJ17766.1 DNA polymerase III subunit gamma/tau [Clostridiaceae bacterium]
MGYTALYRKFRPITFSEIVGQEHITRTLRNQIIAGRVGHAYLFNGGRGTGKTSAAKILARAINCLNPKDGEPCNECEICKGAINGSLTDIVEMDAASNNSVEDIRSIREEVNFLPTKAKYRVYIIDEVHMLSTGAFNALLKTLEEPPEHVKFILATTEPQKLPATILSRCQRFDFKKISNENIIKRLNIVCEKSNIEITKEALNIIAVLSEGAMRDALSILERCIQDGENKIDEDKIKDLVGIPKITYIHQLTESILEYDVDKALANIDEVLEDGKDINNLLWELIKYVKDILVYKASNKLELYSEEELNKIKIISEKVSKEKLVDIIYQLSNLENDIKWSTQKTIMFQAGIIKLCSKQAETSSNLEERLDKIEKYLRTSKVTSNMTMPVQQVQSNEPRMTFGVSSKNSTEFKNTNIPKSNKEKKFSNKSEEYWPQIVNDLKQSGKIVLYTNLMNTKAKEINDMTVGIEFPNGMTSFGKTVLEKPENIREISNLVSIACGKEMQIKYITQNNQVHQMTQEENLQNLANQSDIPFNVIE